MDVGAQVFLLLPGVAMLGDDGVGQVVAHGRGGDARISVGELLDDQGRRHGVHLETFDLLGDAQVEDAQLPGLRDDPEGELVRLVDLQNIREDLVFHETPDRVDVHLLLFIEAKIHAILLSVQWVLVWSPRAAALSGQLPVKVRSAEESVVSEMQVTPIVLKKSRRGRLGPIS